MILKIYFLLLIILIISFIDINENYYTFFTPFKNNKIKILDLNKNNYIYKNIKFGTIKNYYEYSKYLSKKIIKNTNLLNIELIKKKKIKELIINTNSYLIDLFIIPRPIIFNFKNQYKNLRFITNLNSSTFYMIYNSDRIKNKNLNIKNLNKKLIIGISNDNEINDYITKDIIDNIYELNEFQYKNNSLKNLIKNLFDNNNKINIITFIDSNPSNILDNILEQDINNKIKILSIKQSDIHLTNNQLIYLQDFVKYNNFVRLRNNIKTETIYFFNTLLTNNKIENNIISSILKYLNKKEIDKYIKGNNINDIYYNIEPNLIISNKGVDLFYKNKKNNIYN